MKKVTAIFGLLALVLLAGAVSADPWVPIPQPPQQIQPSMALLVPPPGSVLFLSIEQTRALYLPDDQIGVLHYVGGAVPGYVDSGFVPYIPNPYAFDWSVPGLRYSEDGGAVQSTRTFDYQRN